MQLKQYQVHGVMQMLHNDVFIQADLMGLGKTAQTIEYMKRTAGKYIVICPASLKYNWKNEISLWQGVDVEVDNYSEPIIITNYGRIGKLLDDLGDRIYQYKGVVFDEAHALKNIKSVRTQEARKLVDRVGNPMLLTGTPILNRSDDLLGLLYVGKHLQDFHGEEAFRYRYMRELSKDSVVYLDSVTRQKELQRKMEKYIVRRTWADVGLPSFPYGIHKITIGQYSKLPLASRSITNIEHTEKNIVEYRKGKVVEWIKNKMGDGQPLVIFAHHRALIDYISKEIPTLSVVYGGMTKADVQTQIEKFKKGETNGIICSINCASVGHNFVNACDVVFVEYPWTKGILSQAIARCARQGQDRFVDVYMLIVENSFDEYRLNQQDVKAVIADNIIDVGLHEQDNDPMKNLERLGDYIKNNDMASIKKLMKQVAGHLLGVDSEAYKQYVDRWCTI